jgi:hypothetical protein
VKPRVVTATTGISILFSSFAAALGLCCFAPWVVPLLGVSGAILFSRVGRYQPYLLGVAALLMALAVWGIYRSRKACAADSVKRRRLLWLNVFVIVGVLALGVALVSGRIEVLLERSLLP